MKLAIIGGGSAYIPHLMHNLMLVHERLPFTDITLMDTNTERLNIMADYCERLVKRVGVKTKINRTTDLRAAIEGSKIVVSTIRPGGNELRAIDEKIAIKNGVVGQETTGPAGFAFALRCIRPSIEIGKTIEEVAPDAFLISATNPAGIITEAISRYTKAKVFGMCHGGITLDNKVARHFLKIDDPKRVKVIYAGINHLGVVLKVLRDGVEVPREEMVERIAEFFANQPLHDRIDPEFVRLWKWPYFVGLYWHYWYHTDRIFELERKREKTRGEEVVATQKELFEAIQHASHWDDLPLKMRARGSTELERKEMAESALAGYVRGMIATMDGLINDTREILALNVPNQGAIDDLDDEASIEVSGVLTRSGFMPFRIGKLPLEIRGLIVAVKTYETLTIKAAVEGSYEYALKALMAHPLVRQYELAKKLLDEYLIADKEYLPQFKSVIEKIEANKSLE
ncbi:glycoside hydrolase [Thermoanaerobacter wiegelii]|uniref:Glycoside hydrolase family 4 n=1 Tax=Thermoanaerobacter wiegelii Rt8.B1 TaxID=697303 RepID=G2MUV5_9THEO|nr:glycoside hydrolase [Thermoanaerobacter wiegelii]AEM77856.1 glycoside hydrolase family 4 [Thermoanaerobacter wiegelii Rt8.B1]